VHGLNEEVILSNREKQKAKYPLYFDEDREFLSYLKRHLEKKTTLLVAYNSDFEVRFLRKRGINPIKVFDVMRAYTPICKIEAEFYRGWGPPVWKYPKLEEAVRKCLRTTPRKLHSALIDAYYTYKLFKLYPFRTFRREWKKRNPTFQEFFQIELINEYPAEFFAERFSMWVEKKRKQRELLDKFFQMLFDPEVERIILSGKRRNDNASREEVARLFFEYLYSSSGEVEHCGIVFRLGNNYSIGNDYSIIFKPKDF